MEPITFQELMAFKAEVDRDQSSWEPFLNYAELNKIIAARAGDNKI